MHPGGMPTVKGIGKELAAYEFKIQVSVLDCTGCGNCSDICPSKIKALEMNNLGSQIAETNNRDYLIGNVSYKTNVIDRFKTF